MVLTRIPEFTFNVASIVQVQQVTLAKEASEEKSKKRIEFLEKEINGVRFESEYKQGFFLHSQETWAQRFDR